MTVLCACFVNKAMARPSFDSFRGRDLVNAEKMTREELVARMDVLDRQINELKDVDARHKEAEKSLQESEERYHYLFDTAPVGISITNISGDIIAMNIAMLELTGFTLKEAKKNNIGVLYQDPSERQRLLSALRESGKVRNFETKFKHKDGTAWRVLINLDMIGLGDQQVLLATARDVTDLKQAEDALKKERDFNNAVLDTEGALVMVLDREGRILRFNRACETVTGYSVQEEKGKHFWDIFDDVALNRARVERQLAGYYPSSYDSYWPTRSGERLCVSWTNTVLLDDDRNVEYIIATGIDVTERRKAETELQDANQKLGTWVGELEERSREMNQLSEMGELLQSCQEFNEAYSVAAQYIRLLFPSERGALFLINESKDLVEAVQVWDDPPSTERAFGLDDCWALRRGRQHSTFNAKLTVCCQHIIDKQANGYLCTPLMAHGEALGVLYLRGDSGGYGADSTLVEHAQQLSTAVADQLALSLSNIRLRKALKNQAIRDQLTGLFNRRHMEESFERELRRSARRESTVGVIMFDIDHFKDFNDTFGHDGGDALLRDLGSFVTKRFRGEDIACRYGGEEFVLILPDASLEDTRRRAEQMRTEVRQLKVYSQGRLLDGISISLGVAAFPDHGSTQGDILKAADTALYRAKNEGRDRVAVAETGDGNGV
jgi:diguanylate cyclase (GGDEF)-like protein/PAS domain S-box-containing protein